MLAPALVFGATSVGNNTSVGGTLGVTGATTLDGAVTLGNAVNDDITVSGRLGALTISNGIDSTSTLSRTAFNLNKVLNTYDSGYFSVDSSGNVNASGTLKAVGATTLDGAVTLGNAVNDNITVTGRLGTLTISNGIDSTSTLSRTALNVNQVLNTYDSGYFSVDSSGNVNASGTLKAVGATTLDGAVTLGNAVNDDITVTGRLGTLTVSNGIDSTSTLSRTAFNLNKVLNTYDSGYFSVDSSGNVSATGTLTVFGTVTIDTDSLVVNATTNKVGVVSSTPYGQLSVGAGGLSTSSTISVGKFCMYAVQENGIGVYVVLAANQPNNQPFATSTVSCF